MLIEAPNWSSDGASLYVNGNGLLWRVDLEAEAPTLAGVALPELPPLDNHHVLAPDGHHIYLSAMDGHIYRAPLAGGTAERMTPDDGYWHFLHGVSPDGRRLAYVEVDTFDSPGRLAVLDADGQVSRIDVGPGHLDGPEWSPDGTWIYLNTETFTTEPGHAQLARIPAGGGTPQRLVTSATVDWFPHLSPDASHASYLSFPTGTLGHPADLPVEVKVVSTKDWAAPLQTYTLLGGQGTLNVNSWSPDNRRFAFVTYPAGEHAEDIREEP